MAVMPDTSELRAMQKTIDRLSREAEAKSHKYIDSLVKIADLQAENASMREALVKLRDCDWVVSLPDRMDAVRDIARAALGDH